MKAIEFEEQNVIFAEHQEEYESLPAFRNDSQQCEVVTCWKMSFKERLKVLILGELWLSMMTFHNPLTPVYLSVDKCDVLVAPSFRERVFLKLKSFTLKIYKKIEKVIRRKAI